MTPHEQDTFRLDEVREGGGPPFAHPPQNGSGSVRISAECEFLPRPSEKYR